MTKFEVYENSVQYHDEDGDVLELVSATDDGVLLNTGPDGTWVDSKDLAEVVRHMANLSDVDGEFIEASGHEVETLYKSLACGVGESRALIDLGAPLAKSEIVEEIARNLWAIAKVMRGGENRKEEEEKAKADKLKIVLPEVGTYVTLSKGTTTTYGFPVILDEDTNVIVVATSAVSWKVSVSGTVSGRRRVYSVRPEAVTVVRPKAAVGDRVTVAANAATYTEEQSNFDGETTGTITEIHQFDATVLGYSHTSKGFIEQQVALDFLTPAEMPKDGDRVYVHPDAKTIAGGVVHFEGGATGVATGVGADGDIAVEGEEYLQYVDPKYVAVLKTERDLKDARAKLLRGSVPFSALPEEVQTLVDEYILEDTK